MKNLLFALSFSLFITNSALSKVQYVRAMFNSDASKNITIGWDQKSGKDVEFYFDSVYPQDLNFSRKQIVDRVVRSNGMSNHFVRLRNLHPNTKYWFVIKDSEGYSRIYWFKTVSDNVEQAISFIAGGDSRDHSDTRRKGNVIVAKLRPDAVLFNGDFTGLDLEKEWLEWFTDWELTISEDGRISPMVVTRGNHELSNRVMVDLFDVPHKKVYYSTTFGGTLVNIVSLNSEIHKFGRQSLFLKNTLKDHAHYNWQIMQYHRPIRPHVANKKEMETEYKHFVPHFEDYENVRLCLENDSHTCKSTWPIVRSKEFGSEEGFIRDDVKGIVYVGEGCWGAPLRAADDAKCWTRNAEAINQVNWIFVTKEKIEVRTIKYENSAEVGTLTDENRFEMPENIDLWNPSNGAVIEIFPRR